MKRALLLLAACGGPQAQPDAGVDAPGPATPVQQSSSIVAANGKLYVVNPDADSISILDGGTRSLVKEVLLGAAHPAPDATGAFTPSVMPRALAVSSSGVVVTGQRSGKLYRVADDGSVMTSSAVCSEPIGVVESAGLLYVACSQDNLIAVVSAGLVVQARIPVDPTPWSLAVAADGTILVTHLLGPGVTAIDPATRTPRSFPIPDIAPRGDRRLAHGQVRGLYAVAPRPGVDELWVAHVLLGTDTAQPDLDFESTVFPAVTILRGDGTLRTTLSIDVADLPGVDGAFADIVSGPHALAFTEDGKRAIVVDANSEDLLVIDAATGVETGLVRPLPGHMPEGLAIAGNLAFVDQRNTSDIAVVDLTTLAVVTTIPRLASDPMPAQLRLGQHLFYSANSDEYPITKNHWAACASCHLEGRSDAVTWLFAQGPRDTPTNAGGMLGTGFLFRTAARNQVQDYWHTIDIEQGGTFGPIDQAALLDALTAYVNLGIPLPIPPTTDPVLVAAGKAIFERPDVKCRTCHAGPRFTDSGTGNPTLDLAGTIMLHDVGTCVTTGFPDVDHTDVDGHPRAACLFDTPSLSGVASSPPYLHDGRAATLRETLEATRGTMGDISSLSESDLAALVEYLRSL